MSDISSLTELARFVGRSGHYEDEPANRRAVNDIVGHLSRKAKPQHVSELLSVVLTLSARTRRMIMPRVQIDIDVFGPGGQRALRIALPEE
jgi:hypothetical protein